MAVLGPDYVAALRRTLSASTPELTKHLRKEARDRGWPPEAVSQLAIKVADDGKSLKVYCPDNERDRCFTLEYGSPDQEPTAAIRSFATSTKWHKALIAKGLKEAGL